MAIFRVFRCERCLRENEITLKIGEEMPTRRLRSSSKEIEICKNCAAALDRFLEGERLASEMEAKDASVDHD